MKPSLSALLLAGSILLAGCGGGDTFEGAPVVLISIDTLRADRLPAYGYRQVATPAIDALRADSLLCASAYSQYPITLPSHATILSGLLPPDHGVRDNVGYLFDAAKHPHLARLFKGAGYDTGGAVSAYVLRGQTGISQGFDFYEDEIEFEGDPSLDRVQRAGGETARLALDWVAQRKDKPFFLFLHLYEPHTPYEPPEPFRSRYPHPYDGEIAAVDAVVGDFVARLEELGVYDRAVVMLLSDHGEGLGDHGEQQHGIFLYREVLHVPLLLKLPGGRRKGETLERPVALADVAPTLLALAGVERPAAMKGRSLLELADDPETPARRIYAETFYPRIHLGWSELASLVDDRWHYVEAPEPELYDLAKDPAETANVLARERRTYAAMKKELAGYDRKLQPPGTVDQETVQRLAALGYLGGATAIAEGPLPDPKSQKEALALIEKGYRLVEEDRREEAVEVFRQVLAQNPKMQDIWAVLAFSLQKLGRKEEASVAFEKSLELSGGAPSAALGAATAMFDLGRFEEAKARAELALKGNPKGAYDVLVEVELARNDSSGAFALMERAIREEAASESLRRKYALMLSERGRPQEALATLQALGDSSDPATINTLAVALSDAGRQEEARQVLERLTADKPENARAHELLGMVMLRMDRPAEAREHLRRALAINDKLASAWNTLGVTLFRLEGPEAALAAWERALALDPKQYDALLNVGLVAARSGRRAQAQRALRQFVATAPPERFAADLQKARGLLQEIGG